MEKSAARRVDPGRMTGMSFDDLPQGWHTRPLTDSTLAADVVDLVVRDSERELGCISLLLCDTGGRMVQPVTITEMDLHPGAEEDAVFDTIIGGLADSIGGFVAAIGRPRGLAPDDRARDLHEEALAASRRHGVPLLGTYLATPQGVVEMPVWEELRATG